MEGRPVNLNVHEEVAVRALLDWDTGNVEIRLFGWGRGAGKSTILATVHRYAKARSQGRMLRDDPLRERKR